MARKYTLARRAETQAETRQRIVEAAVELHSTLGPSATTISMIADKAGVQRQTLYAHFPDERAMLKACSGHALELDPIPDAANWRGIVDAEERLRTALRTIYDWYERNESLTACILRDAEHYAPVQEIIALRYVPSLTAWRDVLGAKLNAKQRAILAVALSYHTWRTLRREAGLKQTVAVTAMVEAVFA